MYRGRQDPRSVGKALGAAALLFAAAPVAAVLIAPSPGRVLTPPLSAEAGPEHGGWAFVGDWGAFTGVAVSPHHFLTARHVGGRIGQIFAFHGQRFRAVGRYPIAVADMTLWQVEGELPMWAELFRGDNDTRRRAFVIGRGLAPGAPIQLDGKTIGWEWGAQDRRRSWGRAWIQKVVRESKGNQLLASAFTRDGCSLATGDSGGGVFLKEEGRWRLAGICNSVENLWSRSADGHDAFTAAILDGRGLYRPQQSRWVPVQGTQAVPTVWYAARIAPNRGDIQTILDAPLGPNWWRIRIGMAGAALVALGAGGVLWRRRRLRRRSA